MDIGKVQFYRQFRHDKLMLVCSDTDKISCSFIGEVDARKTGDML